MKKLLTLFAISLAVVLSSCSTFDDEAIWNKLDDHESRISRLEEMCREMNSNIDALQTIVTALQTNDYVTSVTPVTKDGETVGYTITFTKSDPITIYHGTDGKDGANGKDGKDGGYTPIIGVKQDADGIYYWTLDGEWLLDENGNKIKAQGTDGKDGINGADGKDGINGTDGKDGVDGADGKDGIDGADGKDGVDGTDGKDGADGITPLLKIENDYWYISYDNGASWTQLGKATGEDGKDGADGKDGIDGANGADGMDGKDGDSFFQSVTQDEQFVYFTLTDGTVITLPKGAALDIVFDESDLVAMSPNSTREIGFTVTSVTESVKVEVTSSADIKAKVVADDESGLTGKIHIITGDEIDEYSKVIVFVSNGDKVIMRSITFEEAGLMVEEDATLYAAAKGGEVALNFLSNVECKVVIPEEAQSWISVVPATRAMEKQTITLKLEHNEGYYRSTTVTVQSPDGTLKLEYQVEQIGDLGARTEREALVALYKATGGDNWRHNTNWCTDAPISSWYGITTGGELGLSDYADNVCEIRLDNNNLTGTITSELYVFSQLKLLAVQWNNISGIDISHNYNLESIACFRNNIKELDTDNNPNLTVINCDENPIGKLNLSYNSKLQYLYCCYCELKELDISNLTQLIHLQCYENTINSLDLTNNINLEWLYCPAIGLSSLDVSNCPKLTELSCWGNALGTLDVSNNRELSILWCGNTHISELDLSNNPKLKSFSSYGNSLSAIDFANNNLLEFIDVSSNLIRELDVSHCPNLATLQCSNNPELSVIYIDEAQTFAYKKDQFTIFVDKNTGETIENLYYISTDYSTDGTVTTFQTATKGNGIDIVLMGDAYSDRQIADGTYRTDMEYIYNNLFTEEPYKSFKDHFNVHYVNVVSATEGYEYENTALDGYFGGGTLVGGNDNAVFDYALNAISEEEMDEALIIVVMNSDNYAGTCYMYYPTYTTGTYGSGPSVAYFPKGGDAETFAQLLHHEACGHGFAKLADEYAYEYMGAVSSDYASEIQSQQANWGWWKNVDFTSDTSAIRWSNFINDARYANEGLGAFEGGLTYWNGVWRPTENSIMRHNTGGFNAPSREAIYYRIHKLAYGDSWEYDYEEFVEWDAINRTAAAAAKRKSTKPATYKPTHAPIIVNKSWRDAK